MSSNYSRAFWIVLVVSGIVFLVVEGETMKTDTTVEHTNRLINESSPYLLQHAHNPVDWYTWSDEAFEKAKREDKPIFLSIGYSTCHWCHVMERESFENERIAAIMNEHFVSIKVDREQRPDVDEIYMTAVRMMTGGGGWPLSVFLTPDRQPFYGGTYFPPQDSYGRPGFDKVLLTVADAWENSREQILNSADKISSILQEQSEAGAAGAISVKLLDQAYSDLAAGYDSIYGGFGKSPKFPQPSNLQFLLSYYHRSEKPEALEMVVKTLDAMAKGGIYDHLGGGFARYSTDQMWLVPHFEKMLYDQALLSKVYIQAYQITGRQEYAQVAREIFEYILRDMTDTQGGFYSAEDADSEGAEGKFYVWRQEEIEKILSKEDARIFSKFYGVTESGNFEHGTNILNVSSSIGSLTRQFKKEPGQIKDVLEKSKKKLFTERSKRIRPHRDDKIITAWNGLMISSLAYGGAALGEQRYIDAAEAAAEFVLTKLQPKGRLLRFYRDGKAVGLGYLEDYAFVIAGLIDLYEATYDARWLAEAKRLTEQMIDLFADLDKGGFYKTGTDAEELIVRSKGAYDGAVPSGNSIAAVVLLRLGRMTMNDKFVAAGEKVLKQYGAQISSSPLSLTAMLIAVDFHLGPSREIVIAGSRESENTRQMIQVLHRGFLPRAVTIFHSSGADGKKIEKLVEFVREQRELDGAATAYICENYSCKAPITNVAQFKEALKNKSN